MRLSGVLLAFLLLVAACRQATVDTIPPEPPTIDRLVVLTGDGNVVTVNPDGTDPVTLTADPPEGTVRFQPLWSPDGTRIAWGEAGPDGARLAWSFPDGTDTGSVPMSNLPFYGFWSPDSSRLAVLHNGAAENVELEVVDVDRGEVLFTDSGAPYYLSWSPDSTTLAAHIGRDRLAQIEIATGSTTSGPTSPAYLAPQWIREGILHLNRDRLELLGPDGVGHPVALVTPPASFLANPQGSEVAVQSLAEGEGMAASLVDVEIGAGGITIVELPAGQAFPATLDRSVGFTWSPGGTRLLVIEISDTPAHLTLELVDSDSTRHLVDYAPNRSFIRNVLPFFAQYAQSMRMWSPDSDALVLTGTIDGRSGVWVLPVDGGEPSLIHEGVWATWSHS